MLLLKVEGPILSCDASYCFQGIMRTSASHRYTRSCRVFHVRRRGGGLSGTFLNHPQGYPY